MLTSFSPETLLSPPVQGMADDVERVWQSLSHLESTYPGFALWYRTRVVGGLGAGTRRLFLSSDDDRLTAVVIAKREGRERKLCTVWVHPGHRGGGLATRLIDEASDWLGERRPLLTVPHERIDEFLPLVRTRGFVLRQALRSYYRQDVVEYVFNGSLNRDRDH